MKGNYFAIETNKRKIVKNYQVFKTYDGCVAYNAIAVFKLKINIKVKKNSK